MHPLILLSLLLQHPIGRQILLGGLFGQGGAPSGAPSVGALPQSGKPVMRGKPVMPRRTESSGTPALQGFNGARSGRFNPNEGGFNGLRGGEMTTPGMASGLYGRSGFGALQR